MNIGDQLNVRWAGRVSRGEVIGFDRGEAVVAFDSQTESGVVVRCYERFRQGRMWPVSPICLPESNHGDDPRQHLPEHVREFAQEEQEAALKFSEAQKGVRHVR